MDDGSWATVKDNKKDKRKNVNRKDSDSKANNHNQDSKNNKGNNKKFDGPKRRPSKEETKNVNSDPVKVINLDLIATYTLALILLSRI